MSLRTSAPSLSRRPLAFLFLAACGLGISSPAVNAQQHDWEGVMGAAPQSPPGLNWKKIETPHFQVVFPAGLEAEGQRVANTLEHVYASVARTLPGPPKRISVFLPNQMAASNGYVAPGGPRHSAFFSTPPQQGLLGTGEWYSLLATHEVRHVVQQDRLDTGFTRLLGLLVGDVGRIIPNLFIPGWWGEGDAVGIETALSKSGRGRQPEFDMEIRTLLLSGKRPGYDTAARGSYKLWYPNEYHLGYLLTTHVKRKYGPDVWAKVISRAGGASYDPFAFSRALKKETGKEVAELYEEAMDELTALWKAQLDGLALTGGRVVNRGDRGIWTSYVFPQYAGDGSLVALKWGVDDPYRFVRLDSAGRETPLLRVPHAAGVLGLEGGLMSVAGTRIAWAENEPDPRWAGRGYTAIRLHDTSTGRTRTVAPRAKLFAPALSPDAKRIAAVEFTPARRAALVVLDAETGAEVQRIPSPDDELLSMPAWSPDGRQVVLTRQGTRGKALSLVELSTGRFRDLIPHSHENIGRPVLHGRYVFHNSSYSGIDNVHAFDLETGQRYQVTSRRFGAFNPAVSPDGGTLAFSDYTARGFDVVEMPIEPVSWVKLEEVEDRSIRYYEPMVAQEAGGSVLENVPSRTYEVSEYGGASKLVNVHSWYVMPWGREFLSVGLLSVNKLNTFGFQIGYEHDWNEKTGALSLTASYQGRYPVLDLGVRVGGRSSTYVDREGNEQTYRWTERSLETGVRLPLNLSRGIWGQWLELGVHAALVDVSGQTQQFRFRNGDGVFTPVRYDLTFGRATAGSSRKLGPEWGQSVQLAYEHTPLGGDYHGSRLFAQARQYAPGLGRNHSAFAALAYERQGPDSYRFASAVRLPRGYGYTFHEKLYKASFDYALPLAYPDFNLGSALNVPRVTATTFFDHARGSGPGPERTYSSTGVELVAETTLFQLPGRFHVGTRWSYLLSSGRGRFEPVFEFSL